MKRLWLRQFHAPAILLFLAMAALVAFSAGHAGQQDSSKWKERDAWQQPGRVMDALAIKPGSRVADVGCGSGYFSFHLATRVGPEGRVYAEDIDEERVKEVKDRAAKLNLSEIAAILGTEDDPGLPAGSLDAILIVDAFHEMKHYDAMLQAMLKALRPGGRVGIIDRKGESGHPRDFYLEHHRIPPELVREDLTRNGFRFLREEPGIDAPDGRPHYFFFIFQKPE